MLEVSLGAIDRTLSGAWSQVTTNLHLQVILQTVDALKDDVIDGSRSPGPNRLPSKICCNPRARTDRAYHHLRHRDVPPWCDRKDHARSSSEHDWWIHWLASSSRDRKHMV